MANDIEIQTADDVDNIIGEDAVIEVYTGWYQDSQVDWADFTDRLEGTEYDFGSDMTTPAFKRLKAIVREYRKAE